MTNPIIEFKDVTFTYPEADKPAVKNLNFSVKAGQWFTILGHNGSGKSTITRLMSGLLSRSEKDYGDIMIDGQKINEDNIWDVRQKIGIVFQNPDNQFVGATVGDDVAFGMENRSVPRSQMLTTVDQVLRQVDMLEYKDSEPANLSGGQKQRVAIAGILAVKPEILVLDEATSMLDPQGRKTIIELVKKMQAKSNLTVISITHDVEEALLADEVMVLNDSQKLFQGEIKAVFSNEDLIKKAHLELPFIFKIKSELAKKNIPLPANLDTEEKLVDALCQLNSQM